MWILIVVIVPFRFHIAGCFFMHACPISTYAEIINSLRITLSYMSHHPQYLLVRHIQPKYIDFSTWRRHNHSIAALEIISLSDLSYSLLWPAYQGPECEVMEQVGNGGKLVHWKDLGFHSKVLREQISVTPLLIQTIPKWINRRN